MGVETGPAFQQRMCTSCVGTGSRNPQKWLSRRDLLPGACAVCKGEGFLSLAWDRAMERWISKAAWLLSRDGRAFTEIRACFQGDVTWQQIDDAHLRRRAAAPAPKLAVVKPSNVIPFSSHLERLQRASGRTRW